MGYIDEDSIWSEHIIQKETTDEVLGGPGGPSNAPEKEITNRTQKINSILKDNAIYVVDGDFKYSGQNIIFTTDFFGTVVDGDFVYWHEVNELFYKAIANVTEAQSKVAGMADVTNGRVITNGVVPTNLNIFSKENVYLSSSTAGESTIYNTGIILGYCIKPGLVKLFIRDVVPSDPEANIPGLRTLGITDINACAGDDSRLEHIGDVTSDSSGITIIENNKVTEAKQILNDNNIYDFSIYKHGYVPKSANVGHFLKDDGTWAAISGGGGTPITLQNAVCGDIIIGRQDLEFQTENYVDFEYYILEEFTIPLAGNYRIKWDLYGHTSSNIFIYKNSQIISSLYNPTQSNIWESFSVDISGWNPGDSCQIGGRNESDTINIKNFKLCVGNPSIGAPSIIYWNNVTVNYTHI